MAFFNHSRSLLLTLVFLLFSVCRVSPISLSDIDVYLGTGFGVQISSGFPIQGAKGLIDDSNWLSYGGSFSLGFVMDFRKDAYFLVDSSLQFKYAFFGNNRRLFLQKDIKVPGHSAEDATIIYRNVLPNSALVLKAARHLPFTVMSSYSNLVDINWFIGFGYGDKLGSSDLLSKLSLFGFLGVCYDASVITSHADAPIKALYNTPPSTITGAGNQNFYSNRTTVHSKVGPSFKMRFIFESDSFIDIGLDFIYSPLFIVNKSLRAYLGSGIKYKNYYFTKDLDGNFYRKEPRDGLADIADTLLKSKAKIHLFDIPGDKEDPKKYILAKTTEIEAKKPVKDIMAKYNAVHLVGHLEIISNKIPLHFLSLRIIKKDGTNVPVNSLSKQEVMIIEKEIFDTTGTPIMKDDIKETEDLYTIDFTNKQRLNHNIDINLIFHLNL